MTIKVSCPCGSRFAFDVEPVDGRMPVALSCPSCGADATDLANAAIQQASAPPPPPPAAESAPATPTAGLRVKGHAGTPPPPPTATPAAPAAAAGLQIRRREPEHPPAVPAAGGSGGSSSGDGGSAPQGLGFKPRAHAAPAAPEEAAAAPAAEPEESAVTKRKPKHIAGGYIPQEAPEPRFLHGVGGALGGAILGGLIWYGIYHALEVNLFWCALIPAALSGWLARWLGRQDNTILGCLAAFFTFLSIFGTEYSISMAHQGVGKSSLPSYEERMTEAQEAVGLKTDDQIIAFLQKKHKTDWKRTAPKNARYQEEGIGLEEIDDFKKDLLPGYKDFVNGKPSEKEYKAQVDAAREPVSLGMRIGAAVGVLLGMGIFGLGYTVFCLGVAYWMGSG
jgi:hypothetical protein